jgi:hypothetical protein
MGTTTRNGEVTDRKARVRSLRPEQPVAKPDSRIDHDVEWCKRVAAERHRRQTGEDARLAYLAWLSRITNEVGPQ